MEGDGFTILHGDELEKTGSLLTPQSRQEKQDLFERTIRDANRLADDFQKELEGKERMLLQKVLVDISGIVERVGKEQGYALILERRRLLLFAEEVDLTEEIIRAYDREAGAKGKK